MHESEKQALGLNERQFAALLNWAQARIQPFNARREITAKIGQDGYVALVAEHLYDRDDFPITLAVQADRTEDGPRCFITSDLVMHALYAESARKFEKLPELERRFKALLESLNAEQSTMESMGFKGICDHGTINGFVSWAKLRVGFERKLVNLGASAKTR